MKITPVRNIYNNFFINSNNQVSFKGKKKEDSFEYKRNSFVTNDNLPLDEKIKAAESRGYKTAQTLGEELGIKDTYFSRWCDDGILDSEKIELSAKKAVYFIDMTSKKTIENLEKIKKEIPDSINKGELKTRYGITDSTYTKLASDKKLIPVGLEYDSKPTSTTTDNLLFNLKNKKNRETIIKHLRLNPTKSKYMETIGIIGSYIPANYLQSLGYATIEEIKEDIKKGIVKGKILKKETPDGIKTATLVNAERYLGIRDYTDYCRARNKNTQEAKYFCEKLGITAGRLQTELLLGNAQIVREYLFSDESTTQFIDLSNPKNAEFRKRIIQERDIELELSIQRKDKNNPKNTKENKVMLEILWSLCPEIKNEVDNIGKEHQEIGKILIQESKRKNLTDEEIEQLEKYRDAIKEIAQKEEYQKARKTAHEAMKLFKDRGINAVYEPEIKKIIIKYY